MKNKKILLSIALMLIVCASLFSVFIPKTKVGAYSSLNGAHMRPVVPFSMITFTDNTNYDTSVCPTSYIYPSFGNNDGVIINSYTSTGNNVAISYVYSVIRNEPTNLGGDTDVGTRLQVQGAKPNGTFTDANLNFFANDFIYKTAYNNTTWNSFKIKPQFSCKYTVMGKYITPIGEVKTLSFSSSITSGRLLSLTTNLNNNIDGDFEYVYFEYLNLYLEKTSTGAVNNLLVDIYLSGLHLYDDEENLGEKFVDDLVNYNPPPAPPQTVDIFGSLIASVNAFLDIEILPDLTFYDILVVCIAIPILIGILKVWLGG